MYNFIEKGTFHLKVIILLWYCGRADYPVGFYIISNHCRRRGLPSVGLGTRKSRLFQDCLDSRTLG